MGMWTARDYAGKRKKSGSLRWLHHSAFEQKEQYGIQDFFLFWILFYWNDVSKWKFFQFPNLLGFEFYVLFCSQCKFYSQQYIFPGALSFSIITLRNPSIYFKEKIRLQGIWRCTYTVLVGRWSCGVSTCFGERGFLRSPKLLKGVVFADIRPASTPSQKDGVINTLFFFYVCWLGASLVLRTWQV